MSKLHQVVQDSRHLRENQEMVARAMQVGPSYGTRAHTCLLNVQAYTSILCTNSVWCVHINGVACRVAAIVNLVYSIGSCCVDAPGHGFCVIAQELCLPYELSLAELNEEDPSGMLLLVVYLFTALPQLLPRATLDFKCRLGESQVC